MAAGDMPVEPFSITCTTCQAKLRVRDSSAVGQILTCPKCGSMVLIESPAAGSAGVAEAADSDLPVELAVPTMPETAPAVKPPPLPPTASSDASRAASRRLGAPEVPAGEFADTVEDLTQYGVRAAPQSGPPGPGGFSPVPSHPQHPTATDHESAPSLSAAESTARPASPPSASAAPVGEDPYEELDDYDAPSRGEGLKSWLLAGAAGVLGIVGAVGVFGWLAGGYSSSGLDKPTNRPVAVVEDSGSSTAREVSDAGSPLDAGARDPAAADTALTTPGGGEPGTSAITGPSESGFGAATEPPPAPLAEIRRAEDGPSVPAAMPPTDPMATDGSLAGPVLTPPLASPVASPPGVSTPDVTPPGAPPPLPGRNSPATADTVEPPRVATAPPDFAPAETPAAPGAGTEALTAEESSLRETLRRLGGLFETDSPPEEPPVAAAPSPEESPPADKPPSPEGDEAAPRIVPPPPRNIDFAARLNDPIPEIEFAGTPFQDFLQFVANYSTIPISLNPDALVWLQLTPRSPVSIQLRDTTVAQLLDAVLNKMGLERQPAEQQLWVTFATDRPEGRRKARLNVADLTDENPARILEIEEHILDLIAPGTWTGAASGGSLAHEDSVLLVEHRSEVLFQVILFCEKLRVARGLPPRSKFNPNYFQLATRQQRAQPALTKPITLNYPRPVPLVQVLNRITKETGVHLLVDWRATAAGGWNPDTHVIFTVASQPLGDALHTLLADMDLTLRIVDETTWQITTQAAADQHLDLEFYRLGGPALPAATQVAVPPSVREMIPSEWLREGGGNGVIRFDSTSQTLLTVLPPARQVRLEQLLRDATKLAQDR
ncbi:MAG: hypothetical protein AB7F89_03430 [Pirellulaceae bacterium]